MRTSTKLMLLSKNERNFLNSLPSEISKGLLEGYERPFMKIPSEIVEYFRENSWFSRILMSNPGTFEMLEKVYTEQGVPGVIDEFLFTTISARALLYRQRTIISWLSNWINEMLIQNSEIKIANLGSGPGSDTIKVLSRNPHFLNSTFIKCVDIEEKSLQVGRQSAKEKGLAQNFEFIKANLMNLPWRNTEDIELLIGILCGLEAKVCVLVLKKIKRYLKKGGILVASNVLTTMRERDPFMTYILTRVIGWNLVFKTPEDLREIFEQAGYKWKGIFFDEPTQFHGMGIGESN